MRYAEQCRHDRRELEHVTEHLADLESRGIEALPHHRMLRNNGSQAEAALRLVKHLMTGHILYLRERLKDCPEPVRQLPLFEHPELP